jgi:acyl carrier protein
MTTAIPSKTHVYEQLKQVLVEEFGCRADQITPMTHLVDDLDLDSIDWIDMAVGLETRTGQKLKEEDLASIKTIQDIVDIVYRRIATT